MIDRPPAEAAPEDIRPIVAMPASNRAIWAFAIVVSIAGGALFYGLEMRRERIAEPAVMAAPDDSAGTINAPPDLALPQNWQADSGERYPGQYSSPQSQGPMRVLLPPPGTPSSGVARSRRASPSPAISSSLQQSPAAAAQVATLPPATAPAAAAYEGPAAPQPPKLEHGTGVDEGKERVDATRFANPATTVPKGTVIQAVLETALDSTRAGFARAIVSRDVYSFDGSHVLIPRGSRIIGDYKSDINLGQKRVLIQWQRLTRPDGVIIDMDSPSADPLGRAGVTGSVNNHFFQRFAGAILQSALSIGGQLATQRIAQNTVYIGLPSLSQGVVLTPDKIQPTIKVKQGSSVSVFVARDLDFTSVQ